jgi:vancomycin aglycone glucosyltransferase
MRVVVTSHGSTGDIFPLIAVCRALRDAGHAVCFATSPPFRAEIESAGLRYAELPPKWSREELAYWMGRLQLFATPLMQLRELYRAASPHVTALVDAMDQVLEGADLLVSSYLFPMNRAIAGRRGVRFATFAFAHNTVPSRYYPPEGVPRLRYFPRAVQHLWNRSCWRAGNVAVDMTINWTIARELRARGLPAVKDFFSKPADLVMVGVSPGLMHPPFRLHPRFRFVGYCRWQSPRSDAMARDLAAFTQGESVPVLTFGSMVYHDPAAWMRRFVRAWPRDRKIVVQQGWAGFAVPPGHEHIKVVGPVSHEQLFAHASVVIHHGGAGTTASVMNAGRPQIVVPHIADQNFFAFEVRRLGCGVKLARAHWPERLAAIVARLEASADVWRAAAHAQAVMRAEDGPAAAVREMEMFVESGAATAKPAGMDAAGLRCPTLAPMVASSPEGE